jgi:hypothetical protein
MIAPLRVGVVLEGSTVPEWQARVLDKVAAEPGLRLSILMTNGKRPQKARSLLVDLYHSLDRAMHTTRAAVLRPVEIRDRAKGAAWRDAIVDGDPAATAAVDFDVVIRLDAGARGAPSSFRARHGVWTLQVGDTATADETEPGLHELVDGSSIISASILAESRDDRRRVIHTSRHAAQGSSLLLALASVYGAAPSHFVRELRRVRDRGAPETEPAGAGVSTRAAVAWPTNRPMAKLIVRYSSWIARSLVTRPVVDPYHWRVAVAACSNPDELHGIGRAPFRLVEQPPDHLYGDPFLFEHDGATWLFMEMLPYRTYRGVLAAAKLDARGVPGEFTTVLEQDIHLSWPFVFSHRGETYMIPETQGRSRIELYRCERFPDRWMLERVLVDGVAAVDTVFFGHGGRLWLLTGICERPGPVELHAYHADHLLGPWRAHPLNPVVSDETRARPAGAILVGADGSLIRPGQDCSGRYGRAVTFNRIVRLDCEEYDERPITRIEPEELAWCPEAVGVHTFNRCSRYLAVDVCTVKLRAERWLRSLRH